MNQLTKDTAEQISRFVNSFIIDTKGFCELMSNDHPTLQQSFTSLCLEWIKTMAEKDERRVDPRNEDAYKVCNQIKEALSAYEGDIYWTKLPTI